MHVPSCVPFLRYERRPRVHADPHPDWAQLESIAPPAGRRDRTRRRRKRIEESVTLRIDLDASWELNTSRRTVRCFANTSAYPLVPSSCNSRVDPSTSANKNVTVPEGRSPRTPASCARGGRYATGDMSALRGR